MMGKFLDLIVIGRFSGQGSEMRGDEGRGVERCGFTDEVLRDEVLREEVLRDESCKMSRGKKEGPHNKTWRDLSPEYHICSRWLLECSLLNRSERPLKRGYSASFEGEISSKHVRQGKQGRLNHLASG